MGRNEKGKADEIVKDKLYTLTVAAVMIGGTLLIGWGVLVILDRLVAAFVH